MDNIPKFTSTEVILSNMSRITIAGAGAAVRGWHPDRIVGDDVLNDASGTSSLWRRKMETWWFGTVGPMAHPGTKRQLGWGMRGTTNLGYRVYAPTKIVLVGTPFHQLDLLMQMRENPLYRFMRYDAEYDPDELVDGTYAVEVA